MIFDGELHIILTLWNLKIGNRSSLFKYLFFHFKTDMEFRSFKTTSTTVLN